MHLSFSPSLPNSLTYTTHTNRTCRQEFAHRASRVNLSLIDAEMAWLLAPATGTFSPAIPAVDTAMEDTVKRFMQESITEPYIITDLLKDPRYCNHPAVIHRPHIRFFAGAPLVMPNGHHCFGTLYPWDDKPREGLTQQEKERLKELGGECATALKSSVLRRLSDASELPTAWVDLRTPAWKVLGVNKQWEEFTGVGVDKLCRVPGILSVMVPTTGADAGVLRARIQSAKRGKSMQAILTPRAYGKTCLQYIVALNKAQRPPPIAAASFSSSLGSSSASSLLGRGVSSSLPSPSPPNNIGGGGGGGGGGEDDDVWTMTIYSRVQAYSFLSEEEAKGTTSHAGTAGTADDSEGGSSSSVAMGAGGVTSQGLRVPPRLYALTLDRLIGRGSFGQVYSGHLGANSVAVKIISVPMISNSGNDINKDTWLAQYEAATTSQFTKHENIVSSYDWCQVEDVGMFQIWIISELCEGGSLATAIKQGRFFLPSPAKEKGTLTPNANPKPNTKLILDIARQIARGVVFLHANNDLHGDLSSNNILFKEKECSSPPPGGSDTQPRLLAKISDFGLRRNANSAATTQTSGTLRYMPMELLLEGKATRATDAFSFGVLLYEMYTGKEAWSDLTYAQLIYALTLDGKRLTVPDDAPVAFSTLIAECLSDDLEKRPKFVDIEKRLDAMLLECK